MEHLLGVRSHIGQRAHSTKQTWSPSAHKSIRKERQWPSNQKRWESSRRKSTGVPRKHIQSGSTLCGQSGSCHWAVTNWSKSGLVRKRPFRVDIPSTCEKEKGNKKRTSMKAGCEKSLRENQQTRDGGPV